MSRGKRAEPWQLWTFFAYHMLYGKVQSLQAALIALTFMFASIGGHFGIDVALLLASNTYSEGCISTLVLARDSGE